MSEKQTPTWIKNFRTIYERYGGGLSMMGFSRNDIGVYVFLFTQKWIENKTKFASFEISKQLHPIGSLLPKKFRTSYSEKAVGKSLSKLAELGFVNEIPNSEKISFGGKPPKSFYEVTRIIDLTESIGENLKDYQKSVLNALSKFAAIEEGITMKEGNTGNQEHD